MVERIRIHHHLAPVGADNRECGTLAVGGPFRGNGFRQLVELLLHETVERGQSWLLCLFVDQQRAQSGELSRERAFRGRVGVEVPVFPGQQESALPGFGVLHAGERHLQLLQYLHRLGNAPN